MRHLIIKNIGPILSVDIELKRFNLLIGVQSSGKSTINKIACYCSWVEKEISSNQSAEYFQKPGVFEERLTVFHMLEGFFQPETYIEYETDSMRFSFSRKNETFLFEWKDRWGYMRPKTIYIPAERNILASIPNWFDIKLEENNIRAFLSDWEEARNFNAGKKIDILNLGVKYNFDKSSGKDRVFLNERDSLDFSNVSSGLKSLIPLLVVLKYVAEDMYGDSRGKKSPREQRISGQLLISIYRKIYDEQRIKEDRTDNKSLPNLASFINLFLHNSDLSLILTKEQEKEVRRIFNNYSFPHYTNIFLEEPEQNLYPTTQRDLVNTLVTLTNQSRKHHVFITTHSPYILTSLNNLLYASEVGKLKRKDARKIVPIKYWIDFDDVGAWFVQNGKVTSILDTSLKQIKAERIDEVSRQLNNAYDKLFDLEYEI